MSQPPEGDERSPHGDAPPAPDTPAAPTTSAPQAEAQDDGKAGAAQPQADRAAAPPRKRYALIARYGAMRQIGEFRHNLDPLPPRGTRLVLRTERGVELGELIEAVCDQSGTYYISPERLNEILSTHGPEYPFRRDGKVLRRANPQDIIDQRHLDDSARDEGVFCRQQIRELKLPMKLVKVDHLLGGERIIFYFTAESRVDFRELVRRLAGQFRTRIEMRQVGARDEARLVADYERCGQRCCCQQFLQYLKPVSMRMAKVQKATLDPAKISGRCSRLMCCLRYEDATYGELRKKLPRKNTYVRAGAVVGKVVDTQILTQLVQVLLPDGTIAVVANEEITDRNAKPPAQGQEAPQPAAAPPTAPAAPAPPEEPPPAERPAASGDASEGGGSRRKRRRRRRRKSRSSRGNRRGSSSPGPAPRQDGPGKRQNPPSGPSAAAGDSAGP